MKVARDRLTITLRKDILRKVDQFIDKTTIRNRSHAIETLITRAITPRVDTAIILAGGEGVKLRPLTYEIPKSLIPIHGKPLVEYMLENLKKSEIRNIIFATGHLGDKIKQHFGDGSKYGVRIRYSTENKPLGSAGAIRNAKDLLPATFLAIHGDILTHLNFDHLIHFHTQRNAIATMALTTAPDTSTHGNVSLRGTNIIKYEEKPTKEKTLSLLINAGIYVFDSEIFTYIPKKGPSFLEKDVFPQLAEANKLEGFPFESIWFDITTPASYESALKNWKT